MARYLKLTIQPYNRDENGRLSIAKSLAAMTHTPVDMGRRNMTIDTTATYLDNEFSGGACGLLYVANKGTEDVILYEYNEVGADKETRIQPGLCVWFVDIAASFIQSGYLKATSGEQPVTVLWCDKPA